MIKRLTIMLITLTIFLLGCDRYDPEFKANEAVDISEFISLFSSYETALSSSTLEDFMALFHDDYNYNSFTKATLENEISTFLMQNTPTVLKFEKSGGYYFNWSIICGDNELFFYDYVNKNEEGVFQLSGNNASNGNAFIELFTGTWCQSCPKPEAALHHLKEEFGTKLSYIEYHAGDDLQIPEAVSKINFYGASVLPLGVVQGQTTTSVTSSATDAEADFHDIIISLGAINNQPDVTIFTDKIEATADQISADINIMIDSDISSEILKLCYAIIEIEDENQQNAEQTNCFQVVKSYQEIQLTSSGEQQISCALPTGYSNNSDEENNDFTLVIWVQKHTDSFSNNSTVYNVVEHLIP